MPNLSGSQKFSFPTLSDFYREVFLIQKRKLSGIISTDGSKALNVLSDARTVAREKCRVEHEPQAASVDSLVISLLIL